MLNETFEYKKALNVLLYIVQQLGMPDFHKAFKALYFAEQQYMVNYGNTIVGDAFIKMEAGPVPSGIYDMVKIVDGRKNDMRLNPAYIEELKRSFNVVNPYNKPKAYHLKALIDPDIDYIAETEKEYLDRAIEYCRYRNFVELKNISHDAAWGAASMNGVMDTLKIAEAGGADEDAIKYLEESILNSDYYSI